MSRVRPPLLPSCWAHCPLVAQHAWSPASPASCHCMPNTLTPTSNLSQDQAFKLEMHQDQDVKSVATDSKASAALEMTGVVTEGSRLSWEEEVKVGRSVRD